MKRGKSAAQLHPPALSPSRPQPKKERVKRKMNEREREFAEWLANTPGTITASLLTWITVHGNLCLALRHPQNRGPSRKLAVEFVKELGKALVEWKALTPEQLKAAEKLEVEEGSDEFAEV